jgi:hypothetical protein
MIDAAGEFEKRQIVGGGCFPSDEQAEFVNARETAILGIL